MQEGGSCTGQWLQDNYCLSVKVLHTPYQVERMEELLTLGSLKKKKKLALSHQVALLHSAGEASEWFKQNNCMLSE